MDNRASLELCAKVKSMLAGGDCNDFGERKMYWTTAKGLKRKFGNIRYS